MTSAHRKPDNIRSQAIEILCQVGNGAHADDLLNRSEGYGAADQRLLREIVLGTLTWRARIDHHLNAYLKKPISRLKGPVCEILRSGAYQILYLDRVPGYAVVSECVNLAGRHGKGVSGLTNAVLRGLAERRKPVRTPDPDRQPVEYLSTELSHPTWLAQRWLDRYGFDAARQMCEAGNTRSSITIRTNPLKTSVGGLQEALLTVGFDSARVPGLDGFLRIQTSAGLFDTDAFANGWFSVQGPGAGQVAHLLISKPGDSVLDVCAAPGGKATSAAEKAGVTVFASDVGIYRLKRLLENEQRLGLNLRISASDARFLPYHGQFDHILVDAPCTGLGTLSRHPEIRWHRDPDDLVRMAELQTEILSGTAGSVSPGGSLLYATCSTEPEENEQIVERFLKTHPEFRLDDNEEMDPVLSILPDRDGTDGAYGARLRKST